MEIFEIYKQEIEDQDAIGYVIADYCMSMDMSDDEIDELMNEVYDNDMTLSEVLEYLNKDGILSSGLEMMSVNEDSSSEWLKNAAERDARMKSLGQQFTAKKSDPDEKRLEATTQRTVNFKWNKTLKQWTKRDKPLDYSKVRKGLVSKRLKWKAFRGEKLSIKATQRRRREKAKSKRVGILLRKMGKSVKKRNVNKTKTK